MALYDRKRRYKRAVGVAACDEKLKVSREHSCGVEDVRAMYLSQSVKFVWVPTHFRERFNRVYQHPVTYPTCPTCRVLFERAAEDGPMKTGAFLAADERGNARWRKREAA